MSSRAAKRNQKTLKARQATYDQKHQSDTGYKRPGSLNKNKSLGSKAR